MAFFKALSAGYVCALPRKEADQSSRYYQFTILALDVEHWHGSAGGM
jgi:hypothetical protein